ncbi:Gfo/Idh/MocA family oxidoreductase [Sphingobium sp. H39-3-25]|uniref:Gfo/Idh/MocA family protein n=1 Tax=Sphingobium arseniciresistens TaxID=3030834 RepID=UPI0023B8DEF3|nr:Gfo/Idh/MocA family oxidoreductase [Sphingobium arseniciresistens]
MTARRLRMGLIGGGPGSFIGPVHRIAAELDREIELVAGAFSSNAARSQEAGASYRIDPSRAYPNIETLLAQEALREDGVDFVAITTPNNMHLPMAKAALEAGVAVLCDKPATTTLAEAHELSAIIAKSGRPFGLTYTYSGYPLVREARARVAQGVLGPIRKVVVEYPQGWLAKPDAGKQAEWRGDPKRSGVGGCIADIGVHAFHLAEFVTGLRVTQILADLGIVVPGRHVDDDCQVLLRFDNGARGALLASQIAVGERNGLTLRIYGEKAGLRWRQEDPNALWLFHDDGRSELVQAGDPGLGADALAATRVPGGHPEGYLEAFANLYRDFASLVRGAESSLIPGITEGLRGMAFIETAVSASSAQAGWVGLTI